MDLKDRIKTEIPNHPKNKQKKRFYIILLVMFAVALAVILVLMLRTRQAQKNAQEHFDALAARSGTDSRSSNPAGDDGEVSGTGTEASEAEVEAFGIGVEAPEKDLDWEALHAENRDIYAWLYIPGTGVDYPILQHPEDDTYYLEHNLDGSQGYPGCVYTERLNSKDFVDQNTVIYGHNMDDGTMFHTLLGYRDKNFFEDNRYAFIYTPERIFAYDIFAAYESGDEHILYTYGFAGDSGFQEYLDMIFRSRDAGARFRDGAEVDDGSRIITLSSCVDTRPDGRYLVQGVLVNEKIL